MICMFNMVFFALCIKVIQEQSHTYLVELKTFLKITIPAIPKKEKEFIPWVELLKKTGKSLDLSGQYKYLYTRMNEW